VNNEFLFKLQVGWTRFWIIASAAILAAIMSGCAPGVQVRERLVIQTVTPTLTATQRAETPTPATPDSLSHGEWRELLVNYRAALDACNMRAESIVKSVDALKKKRAK
jgi:hypothetical protein